MKFMYILNFLLLLFPNPKHKPSHCAAGRQHSAAQHKEGMSSTQATTHYDHYEDVKNLTY